MIFTLLAVLFYAPAWLIFQSVRPLYQRALGGGAEFYYGLEGKSLKFRVSDAGQTVFRSYMKPPFEAELSPKAIISNLPFLLTLFLAAPSIGLRRRGLLLAIGIALLFVSHVAFLVTKVEVSLITAGHLQAGSESFWRAVDNFFEVTGKALFPILIWLSLCLRYMLGLRDAPSAHLPSAPVGRNAPCPCGSGRKYKHCCGKA